MADPATDAAIATRWPERWAKANNPALRNRSKARQQIRKAYAFALEFDAFVAAHPNAKCGNCQHFEPIPHSNKGQFHCSIESDFYGYVIAKADGVCIKHKAVEARMDKGAEHGLV